MFPNDNHAKGPQDLFKPKHARSMVPTVSHPSDRSACQKQGPTCVKTTQVASWGNKSAHTATQNVSTRLTKKVCALWRPFGTRGTPASLHLRVQLRICTYETRPLSGISVFFFSWEGQKSKGAICKSCLKASLILQDRAKELWPPKSNRVNYIYRG